MAYQKYHIPLARPQHLNQPVDSSYRPTPNAGHYGSDGAPASRFMKSIPAAYHYPTPNHSLSSKVNITKSQPRSAQQRFDSQSNSSSSSSRSSSFERSRPFHHSSNPANPLKIQTTRLEPPRAAFVEPQSPTKSIQSFDSSSNLGVTSPLLTRNTSTAMLNDMVPPQFHSQSYCERGGGPTSAWLTKQTASKNKFRWICGAVALVVVLIVVVLLLQLLTKKPNPVGPAALTWANGVSPESIPSFARNSSSAGDKSNHSRGQAPNTRS